MAHRRVSMALYGADGGTGEWGLSPLYCGEGPIGGATLKKAIRKAASEHGLRVVEVSVAFDRVLEWEATVTVRRAGEA